MEFDECGMATVTRDLVLNLRKIDPEGEFIEIYCAVLEEDGKIPIERSVEELKVKLKGYIHPREKEECLRKNGWRST